ncbi:hypothetical protein [Desulforamulus ruminis]|uniref:Uncharacterized protein n=1 Tax=Desulforamulus ruminis (strain ATCC 23193 / DSM 2154 / NCIMB 8452 / DL) TaxID=696281 RepID=F6DVD0_DESRL|nr:hypothetical protein [Desulforamulus ruminis]AEG60283.1 hypothetical protein Desru_2029 [Desulforamulus ruminis DSM 2154]
MDRSTKCRDCRLNEDCPVKSSLNEVAQKVIARTESAVKKEASLDVKYILVTEVNVILTDCSFYQAKEKTVLRHFKLPELPAVESLITAQP